MAVEWIESCTLGLELNFKLQFSQRELIILVTKCTEISFEVLENVDKD